jgi:Uma2 family endonuclease
VWERAGDGYGPSVKSPFLVPPCEKPVLGLCHWQILLETHCHDTKTRFSPFESNAHLIDQLTDKMIYGEQAHREYATPRKRVVDSIAENEGQGFEEEKKKTPIRVINDIAKAICSASEAPVSINVNCTMESYFDITNRLEEIGCHSKLSYDVHTGDITIHERPTNPHEAVKRHIEYSIDKYNIDSWDPFYSMGAPTLLIDDHRVVESDSAYYNYRVPTSELQRNSRNQVIPSIVIEISYSEGWRDLFSKAEVYMNNPAVRMVIIIKLIGDPDLAIVSYCACVIYIKEELTNAVSLKIINIGPKLHHSTLRAIEACTGLTPASPAFIGVGCGYEGPFPFEQPLAEETAGDFALEIPQHVIWHQVPADRVIPGFPAVRIDLRKILQKLEIGGFYHSSVPL